MLAYYVALQIGLTHPFWAVVTSYMVAQPQAGAVRSKAMGSTPAYSNYATALAAYIVQRVSGEDFDTYLDRHIFDPLGMANSTFRQPLPARLAPQMSAGYKRGSLPPGPFEIVGPAPAGRSPPPRTTWRASCSRTCRTEPWTGTRS